MRKFVTQLVRRLPKNFADAVPEAAEEREKNIGWIKRLFTAWRVSHTERTERRAERKEDGEDDSEEDEPVEIQLSDVTTHPNGGPQRRQRP